MNLLVKYVVTDPCYILDNKTWDECCKFLDDSPKTFNDAVSKALTDLTGFPAYVCDTGFGDWSNKIYGSYIIHKEFCADSGMVCVCRLTPEIEKHFTKDYSNIYSHIHNASPNKQNKLLKLLIKDCTLHDKKLKYTVRAPFDKFIKCNNPIQWFKHPTQDLDTYAQIADEVKMVKQQVLVS